MAEWLKAHAWKACVRETVPWVRIPLSPPYPCRTLSRPAAKILRGQHFKASTLSRTVAPCGMLLHI